MSDKKYFLLYFKQLFQLLLSADKGWEDISASIHNPEELQRRGLVPLLGITAASEFIALFYTSGHGFVNYLLNAIAVAIGLFCSVYVARLLLEMTYCKYVDSSINSTKLNIFVTYLIGLNCLYAIINNAFPTSMTLLKLLPLLSVIVIFHSTKFMGVAEENHLSFTGLSILAVIACPIAICGILMLFL